MKSRIISFTDLSCSGKTALSYIISRILKIEGYKVKKNDKYG